jgi:hypothetical protein
MSKYRCINFERINFEFEVIKYKTGVIENEKKE